MCEDGFVRQNLVTTDCVPCANNCAYCIGPNAEDCMTMDEENFLKRAGNFAISPSALEICNREPVIGSDCTLPALNYAAGSTIPGGGTSLTPTTQQCTNILTTEWPAVRYWYNIIFPTVIWSGMAYDFLYGNYFMVPFLWIVEFGPSQLQTDAKWQALITDLNQMTFDMWRNVLAWGGDTPGYTVNSGTTVKDLPTELGTRFATNSLEAQFFNSDTSLCENSSSSMWAQCLLAGIGK